MKFTIILSAIFTVLQLFAIPSYAQVPDDVDGRLWRLAKVWGFTKYYHPDNCNVNWNNILLEAVDSILISSSNSSFNQAIYKVLTAAGQIPTAIQPLVIAADTNLNARFDWIDDPLFTQNVRDQMDSILINFRPKDNCLFVVNDYSDPDYFGWLDFRMDEIDIPSFSYTTERNRMLVLFYYWNIINYFHADKDLMDQSWDTTLFQFIPIMREAQTNVDFHLRLLNMATFMDDTHGYTFSPLISNYFGTYFPFVKLRFIGNETVVTKTSASAPDIALGDIVKQINGIDITVLRDSLANFSAASNTAAQQLDVHYSMLQGPINSLISLRLEDASGEAYTTSVSRTIASNIYFDWANSNALPAYNITQCGYGYVNMGKLTTNQIPLMYAQLKNTPAIIFDIRNYPNGTLWDLIPYFYDSPKTWALFTAPDATFPGWYTWFDNRFDAGVFNNTDPYDGRVIILANAETLSQAEYTVMGLQQHPKSFTIGSQTAGADGNISYITLPGSLTTYWTSLGVFYPDTTTAQRVGIHIDSNVTPTIEDIRLGRDVVLLAALDCLTSTTNEVPVLSKINIYPNPAKDIFYLSSEELSTEKIHVEAFDPLGHLIFQQTNFVSNQNSIAIDAALWPNGIYLITIRDENGGTRNKKIHIQH